MTKPSDRCPSSDPWLVTSTSINSDIYVFMYIISTYPLLHASAYTLPLCSQSRIRIPSISQSQPRNPSHVPNGHGLGEIRSPRNGGSDFPVCAKLYLTFRCCPKVWSLFVIVQIVRHIACLVFSCSSRLELLLLYL